MSADLTQLQAIVAEISDDAARYRAAHPDTTRADLATIKQLLALQIRLLALASGLERDGQAVAHAKQDVAAVCRGDFDEIGSCRELKAPNLVDDNPGGVDGDRVPDPAVDHFHDSSPSFGVDSHSVGVDGPASGDDSGAGHGGDSA